MFSKEKSLQVKGLAILLLVFHHLFYNAGRVEASGMVFHLIPYSYIQIIGICARICVWLFAFISAYGLSAKYSQNKKCFIRNSWLSLMSSFWIPYIVVFFLYWIAYGSSAWTNVYKGNWKYLFLDFFCWSDFFSTPMLMGAWWYMCFAQLLIFLIPLVSWVCKKLDGVWCQQEGILDRLLKRREGQSKKGKILESLLLLEIIIVLLSSKYIMTSGIWQINSLISAAAATLICYWFVSVLLLLKKPGLSNVFAFLGKHSGNMFMVHSVTYIWFPTAVYFSKLPAVSWGIVVVVSLLLSIGIEAIKKVIGYRSFIGKVTGVLDRLPYGTK